MKIWVFICAVLSVVLLPAHSQAIRLYIDVASGEIQPYRFQIEHKRAREAAETLKFDLTLTPYFEEARPPEIVIYVERKGKLIEFTAKAGAEKISSASYLTFDDSFAAHSFANELLQVLTGKAGPFGSYITFISNHTGSSEVFASQLNGKHMRQITNMRSIITSQRLSPVALQVLVTTYFSGNPDILFIDLLSGRQYFVAKSKYPEFSPAWFPDGKKILFASTRRGNTDIYTGYLNSRSFKPLIASWGIDVSPDVSPDGRYIAYTSDSGGSPQIYLFDVQKKETMRLTFVGKYNAAPKFSPDGTKIAFVTMREDGWFDIAVINTDGTDFTVLSDGLGSNESPEWSPDGRFILFSGRRNSSDYDLYILSVETGKIVKLFSLKGDQKSPSWSRVYMKPED